MRVRRPGNAFINVAHVSVVSGIQPVSGRPELRELSINVMGVHVHTVVATEKEIAQLYRDLDNALDQLN